MVTFGLLTPAEIALELGQRLQAHRLQQNKTQAELARHVGVSTPTISNLENGKNIALDTLIHVALTLGLSKDLELLFNPPPLTIAQLEQLQQPTRQRASSPRTKTASAPASHTLDAIWKKHLPNVLTIKEDNND